MKVRQKKAKIDINGKDPEKQTNEQIHDEILRTTREIKENPLFQHKNQLSRLIF